MKKCALTDCGNPVPAKTPGVPGRPRDYCSEACQLAAPRVPRGLSIVGLDDDDVTKNVIKRPARQHEVGRCTCGRTRWLYSFVDGDGTPMCGECIQSAAVIRADNDDYDSGQSKECA
jgi:hypothetical protein